MDAGMDAEPTCQVQMIRILDCSGMIQRSVGSMGARRQSRQLSKKAEPTCHVHMIHILSDCSSMDPSSGDAGPQGAGKQGRRDAENHVI